MIFSRLQDWISSHETLVWWTGSLSLGLLIAGVILLPILLVRLPGDYLSKDRSGGNPGHLERTPRGLRAASIGSAARRCLPPRASASIEFGRF
jgi:hypothetical protein